MTLTLLPSPALPADTLLAALRKLLGDPRVALPFFGRPATPAMMDRYLLQAQGGGIGEGFLFALGSDDSLLGAASLFGGTLSFFVAPPHWGLGIARTLVARLCTDADGADAGLLLSASIYRENIRSQRIVEAVGFSFAGLHCSGAAAYAGRPMLRYRRRSPACRSNHETEGIKP